MIQFAWHSVCKNPDYEFDFEEFRDAADNQMMFAHITVHHFSPSVLKRMRREWREVRAATSADLFAIEPRYLDEKWERFVTPFGFQYFHTIDRRGGDLRRMFVSSTRATNVQARTDHKQEPVWHFND